MELHRLRSRYGSALVGLAISLVLTSCSSGKGDGAACTPGQSIQCAGVNGCLGAQSCNSDGSGYDACFCGIPGGSLGMGGSGSTVNSSMGGTGLGTGTSTNGAASPTGGRASTSTGGTRASGLAGGPGSLMTGGNPNCVPANMSGQAYPAYIPARHMAGSCTEQEIADYYTYCYQSNSCSAFMTGGADERCGACLAPTKLTESALGPLLKVGTGALYVLETNVAGCEEILGEVNCAPKMQLEFLCEYGACANNCPLNDYSSFDSFFLCMSTALTTQCANQHNAAVCLKSSSNAALCSGSSFQEQFTAVARVFCL